MTHKTTNLGLTVYKTSEDGGELFYNYVTNVSGSPLSNMTLIDNFAGGVIGNTTWISASLTSLASTSGSLSTFVTRSGSASSRLASNLTLTDSSVEYQFLNPGGRNRDVTLPAVATTNHPYVIMNTGSATEILTVKDAGGTALGVIPMGASAKFASNASAWISATGRYKNIWVANWQPTSSSGCDYQNSLLINWNNLSQYDFLAFDPNTKEYAYVNFVLPDDYITNTELYAKFYWAHSGSSTNNTVVWGIGGVAFGNGDSLNAASGTAVTIESTATSASAVYISGSTAGIVLAGTSPTAGELVRLIAYRDAADGSDNLSVDAHLIGTMLYYKVG
jgi:hypothetical protein